MSAAQNERATALLGQAAGTGHHIRIGAGVGLIEDDAGVVSDVALQAVSIALQHAGRDCGAAFVGIAAAEDERATALLGQAAGTGQHARISAGVGLIEDDAGIVGDVALQAVSITLQHAGRDRGAAFVGIAAAEDERAAALLGQAAGAGHHTRIGAGVGLIENDAGVVGDVALQAVSITLQHAGRDRGVVAVIIIASQNQCAIALFDQVALAAKRLVHYEDVADVETAACHTPVDRARCGCEARAGDLQNAAIEVQRTGRVSQIAVRTDTQRATVQIGTATVIIIASQNQRAAALLGQVAGARHHTRIGAGVGLIENDAGVVGDVALQAISIALQHAGRDHGTAFVGIAAAEDERATALLGQVAGAGQHASHRCRCWPDRR